ncbi:hypothetical protein [Tolypothrix sp. NIES-4075]|nr:hypothetical protein [Tolypothrix sp. NIES-4075]MBD0265406.1 hypothetical protein [Tolypothrix sp. Co-bin9]
MCEINQVSEFIWLSKKFVRSHSRIIPTVDVVRSHRVPVVDIATSLD